MNLIFWLLGAGALFLCNLLAPSVVLTALLCGVLAAPVISFLMLIPLRGQVSLEMDAPGVTEKNKPADIVLRLNRKYPIPMGSAAVTLEVSNSVTGERKTLRRWMGSEGVFVLQSPWCGCFTCRVVRLKVYDLWGVLGMSVKASAEKRILVMPDTFPVVVTASLMPSVPEDNLEYAPDRRGQDRTETFQIRDYVPGDSLSLIHWKLSSKQGKLLVREPSCPVDQSLMVFVDRGWGEIAPDRADAVMEAAVSACRALSEAGLPFTLSWNGDTIRSFRVNDESSLPEAVAALLKSETTADSGAELYLRTKGTPQVGKVLYLGAQTPDALDALANSVPLRAWICSENAASYDYVQCFTPGTVAEDLQELTWS